MSKVGGCIAMVAIAAITLVILLWMTGAWLNGKVERVADAAVSATGIKDAVARERAANCEQAKRHAQLLWNRSLDDGAPERYAQQIETLDAKAKELCGE